MKHNIIGGKGCVIILLLLLSCGQIRALDRNIKTQEYRDLQNNLCQGWNTWYNNSLISYLYLPEGLSINLNIGTPNNRSLLTEVFKASDILKRAEKVTPGLRADDGSYTSLTLECYDTKLKVETAADGELFMALITPIEPSDRVLVINAGIAFGKDGMIGKKGDMLTARIGDKDWTIRTTGIPIDKEYFATTAPRLNVKLENPIAIYTGNQKSMPEIELIIANHRKLQEERVKQWGNLAESFLSMQTILAWNTIYDARNHRAITPVSRLWNKNWGGYVLFDWDTYFAAYMLSLFNKELAYANAIEITKAITSDGFIPNFESEGGSNGQLERQSSWDRSQPPVGSKIIWEIYRHYGEKWFLKEVYDELLTWNRWWKNNRDEQGYLAWGSYCLRNEQPYSEGLRGAKFESGLDNSPMYDNIPMNTEKHIMELADVGLMSMYIMDCKTLAKIAKELDRKDDMKELTQRAKAYSKKLATLWDEETGIFLNKRLDTGEFSHSISPTNFYPMLAEECTKKQVDRMIKEHYYNPDEFYGEYIMPSIARNCKGFEDNSYWRGRIWGPLNFLVYLGMQNYDIKETRQDLIEHSRNLLLQNWRKNGCIYENYNSVTGAGDDVHNADGFYHWGALLTFIEFMEEGYLSGKQ